MGTEKKTLAIDYCIVILFVPIFVLGKKISSNKIITGCIQS